MIEHIGPVQQILGRCNRHLGLLMRTVGQIVHPVFAINFLRDDGSGLGPAYIPFPFVRRHDNALAFPMKEVGRCGQALLCIAVNRPRGMDAATALIVVTRVGEIKSISDFHNSGIFNAATGFIGRFCDHDRLGSPYEMDTVFTGGVAERRLALMVLGPIQHYEFAIVLYHAWIKCTRGFKTIAFRGDDRRVGDSAPSSEGQTYLCGRRGQNQDKQSTSHDARACTSEDIGHECVPPARLRNSHVTGCMKNLKSQNQKSATRRRIALPGTMLVSPTGLPFPLQWTLAPFATGTVSTADRASVVEL